MSNKTHIAVLLTSHNRKEKTIECLKALYQCILPNDFFFSVFMVDDGSSDGTSIAVAAVFPKVNIIQGNGNLYWNRGMHLAWKTAATSQDFDYYLWLNDDTNLVYNGIIELFEIVKTASSPIIVCGAICNDRNFFSYGLRLKNGNPILPTNLEQKGMFINGNCVLVPRHIYIQVGNLDSVFPHAIGDYDYGLRAIKNGFEILTTKSYIGICNQNEFLPIWCYSKTPLIKRIKNLYSPLGNSHPYYFFIYEKRHFNILLATKHFISIHLRVLVPSLWKI
jgi:GT2 family glycosyltransferase